MSKQFLHTENFKSRLITGLILALAVIIGILTPDAKLFRILFLVGGLMACFELYMAHRTQIYRGIAMRDDRILIFEYVILFIAVYSIFFYLTREEIVLVILGAISTDIFAYFAGSALHGLFFKTKPFPKTSPKKSWEGIIGGYLGCVMVLLITIKIMYGSLSAPLIIFVATCPVISIFGDFFASFCKRFLKIKDSSDCVESSGPAFARTLEKLMTGHGGYLDRVDSISMVACLMFWLKFIANPQ
ncbi:phosphatidate cytidylyltransferase [Candidatus Saccharibacteria bacterium]|nr:phosphatidate cytidylyltransferase [Candidatus Saccharibacteria bacterium]